MVRAWGEGKMENGEGKMEKGEGRTKKGKRGQFENESI
jgi:hypothetical protein